MARRGNPDSSAPLSPLRGLGMTERNLYRHCEEGQRPDAAIRIPPPPSVPFVASE